MKAKLPVLKSIAGNTVLKLQVALKIKIVMFFFPLPEMFGWPNSTGRMKMGSQIAEENTDVFEMWVSE